MKNLIDLKELNPCEDGYKFAASKNSLIEAWNTCERGDWMLWVASKLNCPLQLLTLAKGRCAETVLHLMCDERSRQAVKIAINFGKGIATREELDNAASDAYAASDAAFNDNNTDAYAYNAANAATNAAYAAFDDDDVDATAAAYAAYNAANAATNAAAYAATYAAADAYTYAAADAAANAASDAASDAVANAAADAYTYAAAYAAANAYIADAANASAAAVDAAADAARKENQALTANICREILTDFIKSILTNKY